MDERKKANRLRSQRRKAKKLGLKINAVSFYIISDAKTGKEILCRPDSISLLEHLLEYIEEHAFLQRLGELWSKVPRKQESQMDEKMMPGQKPYTPEEKERRDRLLRAAVDAEEIIPLDELEEYARGAADKAFHDHLDDCEQCEEHPFDLCPEGARLLRQVGRELGLCPHGKRTGECQACDVAGDLAFDAAREDERRNL